MKLEDLVVDAHVAGMEPAGAAKVLSAPSAGAADTVEVTYELLHGRVPSKTVSRSDEARLSFVSAVRTWARRFDAQSRTHRERERGDPEVRERGVGSRMTVRNRIEVPQTTLTRVRTVVDAIAGGARGVDTIQQRTAISARHVDYALVGARVLGLLDGEALSERGAELAATPPESQAELECLRRAIRDSPVLRDLAPGLIEARPVARAELVQRLAKAGQLAESTADQRAGMLLTWRRAVLTSQQRIVRGSRGMWRRIVIGNFRSIEKADVLLGPFSIVVGRTAAASRTSPTRWCSRVTCPSTPQRHSRAAAVSSACVASAPPSRPMCQLISAQRARARRSPTPTCAIRSRFTRSGPETGPSRGSASRSRTTATRASIGTGRARWSAVRPHPVLPPARRRA